MILFIYIILLITLIYANVHKSKRFLHMLQQNLYNENNRYLKWLSKNAKVFIGFDILLILISVIGYLLINNQELLSILLIVVMSLICILIGYNWNKTIINDQNKKKLVVTARIKRLIVTISILYIIPLVIMALNIDNSKICWLIILIESIMLYLNPIVIFIAMLINTPVEKLIYLKFKIQAQTKVKNMPNLKIIGITGSYGKTSSKNILSDILNIKYNALPTPRNLNTFNGLLMTINNNLDKFTDIFIAEMGAYVRGEIGRLCK